MSKKITLTGVLAVVLSLLAVLNVALCIHYVRTLGYAQRMQTAARQLQIESAWAVRNRSLVYAMASEALEYSKKNPAMGALLQQYNPLLEQLNLKPKSSPAPATNKPTR